MAVILALGKVMAGESGASGQPRVHKTLAQKGEGGKTLQKQ